MFFFLQRKNNMKKQVFIFAAFVFGMCIGSLFADDTNQAILDPSINPQQEILGARKLDLRPGDVLPRIDNQYVLGNSNYRWFSLYTSTVNANVVRVSTVQFNDGTAQTTAFLSTLGNKVKQVVFFTVSASSASSSNTFKPTNVTASITPSSTTSQILIYAAGTARGANDQVLFATIFGTTSGNLGGSDGLQMGYNVTGSAAPWRNPCAMVYVDSPGTTSTQTYTVYIKNDTNTAGTQFGDTNTKQVMILIEFVP
jgi:hypothetical protein